MEFIEKKAKGFRYYEIGRGPELYVLLSGWGTPFALADMYTLAIKLSTNARVIVIDRPGYDDEQGDIAPRSFENVCSELASIVEQAAPEQKINVIGHSLGGAYAMYFADIYPKLVKSVITLDMIPYLGSLSSVVYAMNYVPAVLFRFLRTSGLLSLFKDETLLKLLKMKDVPETLKSEVLRRVRTCLYNNHVLNELKYMAQFIKDLKVRQTVCNVPLKIIASETTIKASKNTVPRIEEIYPNLVLYDVGKSSHYVHYDKCDAVYAIIVDS